MGADTVWQSWECSQAGASQHSGSSQSTRPSATRMSECYPLTLPALTLVVVNLVVAVLLEPDVAAGPVPPTLAQTLPALLVVGHGAGAVTPAVAGTPLQGAVLPIPAVGAETRSVTAHTWGKVSLYHCHVSPRVTHRAGSTWGHTSGRHTCLHTIHGHRRTARPRSGRARRSPGHTALQHQHYSLLAACCRTHLCCTCRPCSPRDTRRCRAPGPRSRVHCSQADSGAPRHPLQHRSPPASPSCRHSSQTRRTRGRCSEGPRNPLQTENTMLAQEIVYRYFICFPC